jgi:hypothetical protein
MYIGQIDPIDEDDEEEKDELIIVLSAQELGGDVLCMFIVFRVNTYCKISLEICRLNTTI